MHVALSDTIIGYNNYYFIFNNDSVNNTANKPPDGNIAKGFLQLCSNVAISSAFFLLGKKLKM